ncbi:MAG: N-carbamoylputrescine amidase [Hyphomicrobiales bacterium]
MRSVTLGLTQMAATPDVAANHDTAERLVREAAADGANVVLVQELFEAPYFCSEQHAAHFATAREAAGNGTVARFAALAKELGVTMPVSFFERAGNTHYNTIAMVDADGRVLGHYRKSHIPDGPGYQEKFYFAPGDTGFKVWDTAFGKVGVGICWDQWFPETARCMALLGAEMLLYPTAIGSEPKTPGYDSSTHWQNTMRGHAAANILPLAAANRIGTERNLDGTAITFYGRSFISDWQGEKVAEAGREGEAVLTHTFDLDAISDLRRTWGVFRDRRTDLYGALLTKDGVTRA